jgi:hypothetical protein
MHIIAGERVAYSARSDEEPLPQPITKVERVPRASLPRAAESLRPTLRTVERAILGSRRAQAIIDAWRFRINPKQVSYREVNEQEWEAIQRG